MSDTKIELEIRAQWPDANAGLIFTTFSWREIALPHNSISFALIEKVIISHNQDK